VGVPLWAAVFETRRNEGVLVSKENMSAHDVIFASVDRVECRCGHVALSRFGHDAHLGEQGVEVVDSPDDPTWRADFDPAKWTGTIVSGLISIRDADETS
jgi:hypothetical protein